MKKIHALMAPLAAIIAVPAQAQVVDSINQSATLDSATWAANNVGWFYTPTTGYTLTGIATKFGTTDARTVTARFWSGSPGSLTLLGSGTLSPVANTFAQASLGAINLTAGTTYFFSFGNVSGLSVNLTSDAGATNLPGGLRYDFDAEPGTFNSGPETGFTAQPVIQFIGGAGAVPEPATWAMMIAGFGVIGASMRRRQNVRVSFA